MACRLTGVNLSQCWNIVNLKLRNKLQSNIKRSSYIFMKEAAASLSSLNVLNGTRGEAIEFECNNCDVIISTCKPDFTWAVASKVLREPIDFRQQDNCCKCYECNTIENIKYRSAIRPAIVPPVSLLDMVIILNGTREEVIEFASGNWKEIVLPVNLILCGRSVNAMIVIKIMHLINGKILN